MIIIRKLESRYSRNIKSYVLKYERFNYFISHGIIIKFLIRFLNFFNWVPESFFQLLDPLPNSHYEMLTPNT